MTPRLSLPCHWLACCALVWLVVSAASGAEVRVLERRPVAGGAEVRVLERRPVAGGAEVVLMKTRDVESYSLCYRRPDGSESVLYQSNCRQTPDIQCREKRISLRHFNGYESIIVTLDVNAEEPRLYEDRFRFTSWCGPDNALRLLTADELVIYSESDPPDKQKHLLRDASGRWTFQGLPYRERLDTKVTVFSPDYQQLRVLELPIRFGWTAGVQSGYPITSVPGLYLRLQDVHAVLSHLESGSDLSVTVADEEELLLAQLDAMAWRRVDTALTRPAPPYFRYDWPWVRSVFFSKVRFTDWDLKLPGHMTEYDDAVAELREAYLLYEIYSMQLLAQSAQSFDELAFSALIVHELEKAGFCSGADGGGKKFSR